MTKKLIRIESSRGDQFIIELSSHDKDSFSERTWQLINNRVDIVNIDLVRRKGTKKISLSTLSEIVSAISDFFLGTKNTIICYYCDFLSPITYTKKNITCQQYRSRLFHNLFERRIKKYHLSGIKEKIVTIHGIEDYFVHIIYREELQHYVDILANDIHLGFDKP